MFSVQNGLLTPTLKAKRTELRNRFREHIDQLYARIKMWRNSKKEEEPERWRKGEKMDKKGERKSPSTSIISPLTPPVKTRGAVNPSDPHTQDSHQQTFPVMKCDYDDHHMVAPLYLCRSSAWALRYLETRQIWFNALSPVDALRLSHFSMNINLINCFLLIDRY